MPRLPTPASDPRLPQQVFTADSQGAAVARANAEIGEAGVRLGAAIQERQTQKEISRMSAEFAKRQAELTNEWQERLRTAQPDEIDDVASEFMQNRVQATVEELRSIANTGESQRFFERAAAGFGATFTTTTAAGARQLAETQAVADFETSLNQFGDALTADPSTFESTLATADILTEGLVQSNGLDRARAIRLQSEARNSLAMAAARGRIDADAAAGREAVEAGTYSEFISGQEKQQLLRYADAAERAQSAARKQALQQAADERASQYLAQAVSADGKVNAQLLPQLVGSVVRDPALAGDPAQQRTVFNMLRTLADDEDNGRTQRTDPALFDALNDRVLLPRGSAGRPTRDEIYSQVGSGLKVSDANYLISRLDGAGSPAEDAFNLQQRTAFRAALTVITGKGNADLIEDPVAALNYASFVNFANAEVQRLKDAGESPTDIFAPDGPILGRVLEFKREISVAEQVRALNPNPENRPDFDVLSVDDGQPDPFAAPDRTDASFDDMEKFLQGGE